jgi:rubrerythrin
MAQKTVKRPKTAKTPAKPRARKGKKKKVANVRFVCRDCNASGKGGYFTGADEKGMKCPHCGSANVKLLG